MQLGKLNMSIIAGMYIKAVCKHRRRPSASGIMCKSLSFRARTMPNGLLLAMMLLGAQHAGCCVTLQAVITSNSLPHLQALPCRLPRLRDRGNWTASSLQCPACHVRALRLDIDILKVLT